jgi:hypothetical protein
MSTLHDRLAELAADAPAGGPDPELWERGRRYGRRRRAAVAVLLVAGLVALVSGRLVVASWQPVEIAPAGSTHGLRLPDRLFHPDPWAAGLDDVDPIGPLAAVVGAPRAHWDSLSDDSDIAGVNADGEYVFLDLEGQVGDHVALSPDGRHLAYWYASGEVEVPASASEAPADGVAVLDTVSGEVERRPVDSRLGLMPEALGWAGDRLWAGLWPYDELSANFAGSTMTSVLVWDVASGRQDELDPEGLATVGGLPAWGDQLVDLRGDRIVTIAPDGQRRTVARVEGRNESPAYIDPSGTRVAVLRDTDRRGEDTNRFEPVAVGSLGSGPDEAVELVDLPGDRVARIAGWRSDHELVTYSHGDGEAPVYEVVDVLTGEREELVRAPAQSWGPGERIAGEALAAPVLEAPEPPDLHDPRLLLALGVGGGLAAVTLAVAGLVLWRRRVRP